MIGRIYKVQHLDSSLCYIGSTCNTVRDRWRKHKCAFKMWVEDKQKYATISLYPFLEQYGIDRFQMLLIREYQIVDKQQLRAYEQLAINRTKNCCNQNAALQLISTRCMVKHRYQINQKAILEQKADYYQANKQAINEKAHEYYQSNKQTFSDKNREYRQANKQAISEQKAKLYQANKQSIQSKASVKVECECGIMVRKSNISIHRKTVKHVNLLAALAQ